ncbi:helix-turn-helix transcriptional regulator [Dactylosporangium aurantiacum]|uniref:Helix-turn-helix transcriptional regulator n=1 Tax=Dactylosporangium aurantiacum TaxID=35754 RepID=A0A9Q9MGV2_9ACTN|nr:helix-turn-helix domain-containing protein [Dactylosporangium aurantiacum]MDG6107707.1 helix-turn-helix domain-containing protein [Dactylosporangium aurantiacum]UWZ58703.1 helix-turn-helix transcriptional regulator [Dactylosporangium aurantiacum]
MTTYRDVNEHTSSWDPYVRGCPSRDVLDQIGSKWAVLVLGELGRHGACRFTQLRQRLSGISEKMLAQTLRTLERDGLLLRTVYPETPIRVEYELTPLGETLRGPLKALTDWSVQHIREVLEAREEYDERAGKR